MSAVDPADTLLERGSFLYSYRFTGPSAESYFFMISVHDASSSEACRRYGLEGVPQDADFWFLAADIANSSPGQYPIAVERLPAEPKPLALVDMLRRKEGTTHRFPALGGSVELDVAPPPDAAKSGATLTGTLKTEFPLHAVEQLSCRGNIVRDGAVMESSCSCLDTGDVSSECTPSDAKPFCCYDEQSARKGRTTTFRAAFCPAMCRYIDGAPNLCAQLFPNY